MLQPIGHTSPHHGKALFIAKVIACLVAISAAMWPGLSGGFIFDDFANFVDAPAMHVHSWDWQSWHQVWVWSQESINRPLAMFSYALNYALGGSTFGFKAANLVIHLINTVLLAMFSKRLLTIGWKASPDKESLDSGRVATWALILATAWALHPLQVSAVMYVVQRMELLGFTFTLLALRAYWSARQRQIAGGRAWPYLALSVVAMAVGYGAKETCILIPGYALLLEITLLHFQADQQSTRRNWKFFYALGCVLAALLFMFYLIPHYTSEQAYALRGYTAWERTLTQLRVLSLYIGWCVVPLTGTMRFYYDNYAVSTGWLSPNTTLAGGLFLLSLVIMAFAARKRRPLLALGIGWFFMAHLLTSSPIPLELAFEHRNYPALFGILLALTDLIWMATRRANPKLPALLATICLVSFGFLTVLRAATWGKPVQLAVTLAEENPGSPRASYDLANLYMQLSMKGTRPALLNKAVSELERGMALPNSSPLPEQALLLLAAVGKVQLQQAWWDSLLHKLKTRPFGPQEANALRALMSARINNDADVDVHRLQEACALALKQLPWSPGLYINYAELASHSLHDPELAIQQWQQALILIRGDLAYEKQIAGYLIDAHRLQEAAGVMDFTEKMEPSMARDKSWHALRMKLQAAQKKVTVIQTEKHP
ncbi:hypothetical protein ASD55_05035 [Rhodanobacter sp. Root561]|uniref:hypothetical protein n=1 Tax=Rhodanobacter sp. Root561 TaxID=1736560 RepID=UPI0006FF20DE|nr:hypothetical protein [Rhodanobacter sp. Root561]KQZ80049.1 hypothetical protein ASD55_05035 [Rhodanobacter sp. Root561]